ncbi:MAG: aminomethyl-transferring glycine dehydrogenase subunit GcvPA [Pirellulales bacterium]
MQPYLPNTTADEQAMLEVIGAASVDELFASIPGELRMGRPLDLPPAMGEMQLTRHVSEIAAKNASAGDHVCFLGGGAYDHFIPAVVDTVAARGEFYTAYTPYQAEASQGTLQAMFEYQTLIARLTGMDVSNASLYDGASATAEAVLMALGATRRRRVVAPRSLHPEYRQVLATYLANLDAELVTLPTPEGTLDPQRLTDAVDEQTACVIVQHPNFFGCLERAETLSRLAREAGALTVGVVDPVSLGLLRRPGDWGADIVAAEGHGLGCPMAYGGPFLGILACTEKLLRRMPGRLVGETTDRRDRRCFVLTMQTREQHIRREKATSNICTNQGLLALRASVHLALLGPRGLRQLGELCLQKANYARERLTAEGRLSAAFEGAVFKEFVVRVADGGVAHRLAHARAEGILAGVPLGRWYPELADCLLVAVTEKRTREEIDRLAEVLAE